MTNAPLKDPLVSCLCVTEDRAAFMPWLLWNFDRQTWAGRELVIVDSSAIPFVSKRSDVRVVHCPIGTSVAEKRNRALTQARGRIATWFDDDDWQHPEKLALLVRALGNGAPFAGPREAWFADLGTLRSAGYTAPGRQPIFNGSGFRTDLARRERFPTEVKKASDTKWMRALQRRFPGHFPGIGTPTFFWLCHDRNLSNPAHRRRFDRPPRAIAERVGAAAWGDTDAALEALRNRLAGAPPEENKARPAASDVRTPARAASRPPVTAVVKATVLDAAYLGTILPHMLGQARYKFAERIVSVDPRTAFSGKYRTRDASDRATLDRVLQDLKSRGEIDRVIEVPSDAGTVAATNKRYFGRASVPTHATTGGPVFATLWAMDQAPTDMVAQFDADMLFYTDGESWIARALDVMKANPDYRLMMTHPGPPAGPEGRSLAGANQRRASWDADMRCWRFNTASTRFFLTDRRTFHGSIPVLAEPDGVRPLEQMIGAALVAQGAWRGDIGTGRSWHIHAHNHAAPFAQWAPALVAAVTAGHVPRHQIGSYDMRLDKPDQREAWRRLLFGTKASTVHAQRTPTARRGRKLMRVVRSDVAAPAPAPVLHRKPGPAVPIHVVIPVRDRGIERLRAVFAGLGWQNRPAASVVVVSHGSAPSFDAALAPLCAAAGFRFETMATPDKPWCKSAALNAGLRLCPAELPYAMTLDADMILAPNLAETVADALAAAPSPGAIVLCRSRDLPRGKALPDTPDALRASLPKLSRMGRLRGKQACGGIQAFPRSFFLESGGYDEDFIHWGEEDRDMFDRAETYGLRPMWVEDRSFILHQWHPHAMNADDPHARAAARAAYEANQALRQSRAGRIRRGAAATAAQPAEE